MSVPPRGSTPSAAPHRKISAPIVAPPKSTPHETHSERERLLSRLFGRALSAILAVAILITALRVARRTPFAQPKNTKGTMLKADTPRGLKAAIHGMGGVNKHLDTLGMPGVQFSEIRIVRQGIMKGKAESAGSVANIIALLSLTIATAGFSISIAKGGAPSDIPSWLIYVVLVVLVITAIVAIITMVKYGIGVAERRVAALHLVEYRLTRGHKSEYRPDVSVRNEDTEAGDETHR